ncbi:2-succinyl-5-enolpyruvyl-6-hydroxy-3-cyclohexene-1-carboxylic-acid synthase [Ectobacillus ponti]|uniref:2-succinyl-5-enolpyruvyl-6-hydroxy-3-cyclohexene-1-carboxylate synthase n=1 Tax=Ectobacillus ponti TaxID=2961894 RepID=A0AA42BNE7_9BACI|nr:2-succinyl-5-enolpyruvyl-6-hydroxy-3-cyclohexene-1-carboxylic-acid synthase [Ectobacillus ponti]MCP8967587.1 2-succinyl-5-enolpyruvyl-6-hydroxy-3-cyclohexene-1-carboxylic-acid synthase [Ectobacillus ponti]
MSYTEGLTYYLGAFADELVRLGIQDIVISPGSRSTPLALLFAEHEGMRTYLHVDERSAAFFALGIAKAKQQPVALLCTSGTAAANYMPAVSEAFHARVPLLVLTADRPHELRDVGAPQAMNQINLFGSFVKGFVEMAVPEASETLYRYVRTTAARAAALLQGAPHGPVHLNFPLREPLVPDFSLPNMWDGGRGVRTASYTAVRHGEAGMADSYLKELGSRLSGLERGLIVCGDLPKKGFAEAVAELAAASRYPILADPLSQVRSGPHDKEQVLDCYDTVLRHEQVKEWKPEVIIRFGAMPVSKALTQYMQKHADALHIVVDEGGSWRDPSHIVAEMVYAEEIAFCRALAGQLPKREESPWLQRWQHVNSTAKAELRQVEAKEEAFEGRVITEVAAALPEQAVLFVGNSMPIRDTDTFYFNTDKSMKVMANRGVNGIDGLVSTALGLSTAGQPLLAVLGDLSFYHDLNGLLAAKLHNLNATFVIVNNDGGGIFSFLPQYGEKKHFEYLFGTPLGLDYEHVVKMYGGSFRRVQAWEDFRAGIGDALAEQGLSVVEIHTDREHNLQAHRALWSRVMTAIDQHLEEQ